MLRDGEFSWPKNQRTNAYNYKVLAYHLFLILCVIGNHEPILGRNNIPEVYICLGATVYQISPMVSYLKRDKRYVLMFVKKGL
jgi:hypothetical protein